MLASETARIQEDPSDHEGSRDFSGSDMFIWINKLFRFEKNPMDSDLIDFAESDVKSKNENEVSKNPDDNNLSIKIQE